MKNPKQIALLLLADPKSLTWSQSKSGGSGGQHVNKTRSKAELQFDIPASSFLTDQQKNILLTNLPVSKSGIFRITAHNRSSWHQNKSICEQKFIRLIEDALTEKKTRTMEIPKKILRQIKYTKKYNKQLHSKKKAMRNINYPNDIG